ncbi:hypothetical protein JOD20_004092 [Herpetosiphon giganteus]|nr:hypothetical protein [Herpetosiphon giganteus]
MRERFTADQSLKTERARGVNPVVLPQFLGEKRMLPLARVQWERGLGGEGMITVGRSGAGLFYWMLLRVALVREGVGN